jgi:hypothetical protein
LVSHAEAAILRPERDDALPDPAGAVSQPRTKRDAAFSASAALSFGNPRASSRVKSSGQQREYRED